MKPYYCANCNGIVNLDVHGRCGTCDSDAVDIALRPAMTVEGIAGGLTRDDLEELRIWSLLALRGVSGSVGGSVAEDEQSLGVKFVPVTWRSKRTE